MHSGADEMAMQHTVITRRHTENAMKYAFELAKTRGNNVTSATKSNGIVHSMPFCDEVFKDVANNYENIETSSVNIDALDAYLVSKQDTFNVIFLINLI